MLYSFSRTDKILSLFAVLLLIVARTTAATGNLFSQSSFIGSHIIEKSALYTTKESTWTENPDSPAIKHVVGMLSGYIRRDRNDDLVIAVPEPQSGKYSVRFFEGRGNFLFEVKQIRDSLLIVEKSNFQHAGVFRYELYRAEQLVEKNSFLIRQD